MYIHQRFVDERKNMSNWVKGIYKKELPNRFMCEVDVGGKTYMCYQPLSFKLNKIMDPEEKEVLLTKINKEDSDLAYIVYAIGIDKKNYALLNLQLVNQIFRDNIDSRKFLFLGKRSNVICEKKIERLKTDLYVQDTNTVIEVKTIFSFEKEVLFPNIKSYRIQRQIEELTYLLEGGYKAVLIFAVLTPCPEKIIINRKNSVFFEAVRLANRNGLIIKAYRIENVNIKPKVGKEIQVVWE